MATVRKNRRLKEADQLTDQNMTQASAEPATQADMAAAPVQPDMPAVDPQAAPIAEEPAMEDSPVEVEPETVSMEVKVPTDQIAAAVAQSTGDVVPAEAAPDSLATQETDLVQAAEPTDVPAGSEGGEEAPVEDQNQQQPVMESRVKRSRTKKIAEAGESFGELEASEAAEKHDEDKLEQIIDTGVKNQGIGAMENGDTSDGQNRLDLIKTGVDNMKESAEDPESLEDADEDIEAPEEEEVEEEPVEDKIKAAGVVDTEDLPSMGEEEDVADGDLDDLFDEPDSDEYIDQIEDFLGSEDVPDIADNLRKTASFLDQIAQKPGEEKLNFQDLINGDKEEGEEDDEGEELLGDEEDFEGPVDDEEYELDLDDDENEDGFLLDDDEEEEDDEEPVKVTESLHRRPITTSRRQTRKPYVTQGHPLKENSIIYPAGSAPLDSYNDMRRGDADLVRRQEKLSQSRREAIKNYRRTLLNESRERRSNSRFNEALRTSVRSVRDRDSYENSGRSNSKSWENNTFVSKYEESSRLNYQELLKNHLLG